MAQDAAAAFAAAAARDGLELEAATFDWLGEQGHVGLERVAKARRDPALVAPVMAALDVLEAIFAHLKGDPSVLDAGRENLLLGVELVHGPTGTVVAVDGPEHFTSFRGLALDRYPDNATVGFDLAAHRALCRELGPASDRVARGLAAKAFGFGGVPRERAYNDALLDLGAVAMGRPPVVRVAAPDGDGAAAYAAHRASLRLDTT